ncbi:MAG: DUF3553 domain-containing protein [Phycisphaerales bacterium]
MGTHTWSFGDRVRHPGKPEWGIGHVTAVEPSQVDGVATQRVTVRFERAGLKKLAASVARLEPAGTEPTGPRGNDPPSGDANANRTDDELRALLIELPEACRDPFRSVAERFKASLSAYRFTGSGGSLLDWAASQTRLADPLTRFSRHDLEEAFARFRRRLDKHTTDLGLELVRAEPALAGSLVQSAPDEAKALMRRLAGRR